MAQPGDTVFVMSAILVPEDYAIDVIPGVIWKQTGDAERRLRQASALVSQRVSPSVSVRYVRVQARDYAAAIIAGAQHFEVHLILFASRAQWFGRIIAYRGIISRVARHTACGVRVVSLSALSEQHEGMCSTVPFAPSLRGIHLPFHGV